MDKDFKKQNVFGLGNENSAYAQYFIGKSYLNPLFPRENRFREIYLLAAGAEDEDGLERGALSDIQGWADCFEGVRIAGVLCAKGVQDRGDVAETGYPERAYALGRDV